MFIDFSARVTITDEEEKNALKETRYIINSILETMNEVSKNGHADFATYSYGEVAQVAHILSLLIDSVDEGGILIS